MENNKTFGYKFHIAFVSTKLKLHHNKTK